jgi:hypothetical protein
VQDILEQTSRQVDGLKSGIALVLHSQQLPDLTVIAALMDDLFRYVLLRVSGVVDDVSAASMNLPVPVSGLPLPAIGVTNGTALLPALSAPALPACLQASIAEAVDIAMVSGPINAAVLTAGAELLRDPETVTKQLSSSAIDLLTPLVDEAAQNITTSAIVGLVAAAFGVTAQWLALLASYKRIVLAARRKDITSMPPTFEWAPDRASIASAIDFIGIQVSRPSLFSSCPLKSYCRPLGQPLRLFL